jgi:signal peptidase II
MAKKKDRSCFFISALAVFLADQVAKAVVRAGIAEGSEIALLKFFSLRNVMNTGAGFSILQGQNALFIWIGIVAAGLLLYFHDEFSGKYSVFAGMALGGVAGNLVDRIVFGGVTDFLDFKIWPVFNLADASLTIGILLYAFYAFREK